MLALRQQLHEGAELACEVQAEGYPKQRTTSAQPWIVIPHKIARKLAETNDGVQLRRFQFGICVLDLAIEC